MSGLNSFPEKIFYFKSVEFIGPEHSQINSFKTYLILFFTAEFAHEKDREAHKHDHERKRRNTWDPTKKECTLLMVVCKI